MNLHDAVHGGHATLLYAGDSKHGVFMTEEQFRLLREAAKKQLAEEEAKVIPAPWRTAKWQGPLTDEIVACIRSEEEATDHETHMRVYLENQRELNRKVAEHAAEHEAAWKAWKARQEEAKRPKRDALGLIEATLKSCSATSGRASCCHSQAADILKALREKCIPWLRGIASDPALRYGQAAKDILEHLGEDP